MPWERIAEELADMLGVLAHPQRIRIIDLLKDDELDVSSLQRQLDVSQSQVSQHLALLRSRRLVTQRKSGRRRFYRLTDPQIVQWLFNGVQLLGPELEAVEQLRTAVHQFDRGEPAHHDRISHNAANT